MLFFVKVPSDNVFPVKLQFIKLPLLILFDVKFISWKYPLLIIVFLILFYIAGYVVFRNHNSYSKGLVHKTVISHNDYLQKSLFYGFIPLIYLDKMIFGRISQFEIALYFYQFSNE